MKKVLLLGGAGFIGFHIAKKMLEDGGYQLHIADNLFRSGGEKDDAFSTLEKNENIKFFKGDFTNPRSFDQLEDNYDYVYMLASMVGVDYVNTIPHEIIRVNTALIYNTLEWLKEASVGRVLFTSTSECYAGAIEAFGYDVPTPEEVPLTIEDIRHPRFTYAVTKMLGESGFIQYGKFNNFDTIIVRYHNVFGPRMGFKHVIPHLVQRFLNNENPFKVYGHDQTRSFNFIDDAVKGTILAAEKGVAGEIYHIGEEDEITIEKLVKTIGKYFNFEGEYENAPTFPGSVARRCPDISKAKNDLGYTPDTGWENGLERTLDWYKEYVSSGAAMHESFYDNKKNKE